MDGYAVRVADCNEDEPLSVGGTIAAGHPAGQPLPQRTALRIMTGSPIPDGADAVIMREEAAEQDGQVRFVKQPRLGQHIRHAGEDEMCIRDSSRAVPGIRRNLAGNRTWAP